MSVRQRKRRFKSWHSAAGGLGWGGGGHEGARNLCSEQLIGIRASQQPDKFDGLCCRTQPEPGGGLVCSCLFLFIFCPGSRFFSGSIKFCHRRIKLSHCDTIFESHIHNLWIYCGGGVQAGGRSERGQSSICSVRSDEQNRLCFIYFFIHICRRK